MTLRARRTIFYVFFGLFFIIGAAVVFYAQGWRFDLSTWRFQKVGAILVRSFPTDASITLNGKVIQNQSGFFSQGTLISGLLPRNYDLALAKDGYADWHENASVLPSLVTEFKYAVLVPKEPASVSTGTVTDIVSARDEIVTRSGSGAIEWHDGTIGHGAIVSGSADLGSLIFKNAATGAYDRYDLAAATSTNFSAALSRAGIAAKNLTRIAIDPYDATKIILESPSRIWIFDIMRATSTPIDRTPANETRNAPLAPSPSFVAWTRYANASLNSSVVLYDKSSGKAAVSSSTVPGATVELAWINNSLLGVLQSDGSLYSYDINAKNFNKIADDVKYFSAADDGSTVAALEGKSLEVLPFADPQTYRRFNLPRVAEAERLIWYKDANHLFIAYPDSVALLDLADLGLRNLITVGTGSKPLYNSNQNILYLINSAQKLEEFDFPD